MKLLQLYRKSINNRNVEYVKILSYLLFINSYRLDESINQLKNKDLQKKTVLEILYDSGFNSKSSFYSLFEKHTGKSPTQFRKKYFQEN